MCLEYHDIDFYPDSYTLTEKFAYVLPFKTLYADWKICLFLSIFQIAVRKENERGDFAIIANYLLVDENWLKNVATVTPSKVSF